MLEKDIQKVIVDYLRLMGLDVAVTDASRVFGKDGKPRKSKVDPDHPDLTATLPVYCNSRRLGLAFYVEVKTETGSIRAGQKLKLKALSDAGAVAIIARDLDVVRYVVTILKERDVDEWEADKLQLVKRLLELQLSDFRKPEVKGEYVNLVAKLKKQYEIVRSEKPTLNRNTPLKGRITGKS